MKKRLSAVLALLASACLAPPARAADEQASLVVAVDGNDANPGTLSQPFATLERARDEVRKANAAKAADKPIVVAVRGGDYFRTQALELTAGDSGTAAAPVIWRAYNEERVRLLGGRTLTGFPYVPSNDRFWHSTTGHLAGDRRVAPAVSRTDRTPGW
jgi:hypothetical protein